MEDKEQTQVVKECCNDKPGSCRGCKYSYDPSLYDGGCRLYYAAIRANKEKG